MQLSHCGSAFTGAAAVAFVFIQLQGQHPAEGSSPLPTRRVGNGCWPYGCGPGLPGPYKYHAFSAAQCLRRAACSHSRACAAAKAAAK